MQKERTCRRFGTLTSYRTRANKNGLKALDSIVTILQQKQYFNHKTQNWPLKAGSTVCNS